MLGNVNCSVPDSSHTLSLLPWMPESYLLQPPENIHPLSFRLSRLCLWIKSDQTILFPGELPTESHIVMETLTVRVYIRMTRGMSLQNSYQETDLYRRPWSFYVILILEWPKGHISGFRPEKSLSVQPTDLPPLNFAFGGQ